MRRGVIVSAALGGLGVLLGLPLPGAAEEKQQGTQVPAVAAPASVPGASEKPADKPADPPAVAEKPAEKPEAERKPEVEHKSVSAPAPAPATEQSSAAGAPPAPEKAVPEKIAEPAQAAPAPAPIVDAPKPETPATAAAEPAKQAPSPVSAAPAVAPVPEAVPSPPAVAAPAVAAPATPPPPAFALDIAEAVRKGGPKSGLDKREADAIAAFYAERQGAPLWHSEKGRTPKADALIAEIGRAGDFALETAQLDPGLAKAPPAGATPDQQAADEARIAQAFLKYARHARGGRITDPSSLSNALDRQPRLYDPASLLSQVATAKDPAAYLRQLHPQHPQFEKLRQRYLAMRKSQAVQAANLPGIPDGPRVQPGASHPHVALVRARLGVPLPKPEGAKASDESRYDDALVAAVKEFQVAKGLKPADGSLGNGTRQALNAVAQGNPKKLLANLEQWRWMPDNLGSFYVWVNIPEYTLRVVSNGQVIHTERVIVGKTDTQTPVFSDEMEQVIFHPFWGVPDGIKSNEIQPSLAKGQFSVLQKHNLRIASGGRDIDPASVNWQTADLRRFHVYQPPGGDNVLGVVKFRFPNKHDVYMHDTPTKSLFNTTVRTYSHGCMRVQNPVRLAEILLAEDKKMTTDRVRTLATPGSAQNNQINLTRKLPVHITYFTAAVEDDGKPRYFADVYGHETRINLALEGKAHLIPKPDPKAPPLRAEPVASLKETTKGPRDWARNVFINN